MKIKDRGFWISKLYRYQSFLHALQYAFYFRRLTFFSATNPNIYLGGLLDEKKSDIYDLVPERYVPQTMLVQADKADFASIVRSFTFPLILKPNVGYKGFLVRKIDDPDQLQDVLSEYGSRDILIQEFIDAKHEYSVMYYRLAEDGQYGITSLVEKHLPAVIGNGQDTLKELIDREANPFLNKNWLLKKYKRRIHDVVPKGHIMTIDHIGNYSRGAKFENLNAQIDDRLSHAIHAFLYPLGGFNFCRLDVKAQNFEALKAGHFKILEINGAKSEPLHIYDPDMSWWGVIKDIRKHWRILFKVVKENNKLTPNTSTIEGLRSWRSLKKTMDG